MPVKSKATPEEKLSVVQLCESGELSQTEAAERLGLNETSVNQWVIRYREQGPHAFMELEHNQSYSPELKLQAVLDYLSGGGSQMVIAAKYGLRSKAQLQRWIKMYNEGRDFGQKRSGGSHMTTPRKTTKEERVAIVNLGFVAFHRLLRSGDHSRSDRMGQTVVSLRAFLQFPPVHYAHDVLLPEHVS